MAKAKISRRSRSKAADYTDKAKWPLSGDGETIEDSKQFWVSDLRVYISADEVLDDEDWRSRLTEREGTRSPYLVYEAERTTFADY